ncbi:hypothetical protein DLJ82_5679 (plasmid) [Rhizobium leguminosarum]|uniref:Uncharacterized protein n=1 Tax=Rhizobium leguminosarum TaxID=384 RepID=A0A2Z4YP86_RHILE|nr:hypothetical protein DLJ82_5679 [Rhizobium leguminosarum]
MSQSGVVTNSEGASGKVPMTANEAWLSQTVCNVDPSDSEYTERVVWGNSRLNLSMTAVSLDVGSITSTANASSASM